MRADCQGATWLTRLRALAIATIGQGSDLRGISNPSARRVSSRGEARLEQSTDLVGHRDPCPMRKTSPACSR